MTLTLNFFLLFLMVLSFGLASFNVAVGRLNLIAIGLLCFALTLFVPLFK